MDRGARRVQSMGSQSDTAESETTHTHTQLTTELNFYTFVAPEELVFPAIGMCGPVAFNPQHSPGIACLKAWPFSGGQEDVCI